VLRVRERTPTPFPSIVFTFGFAIEFIKEFGGVSVIKDDKEMFEEVQLRFPIVGHTYEDIHNCFGYLSKKLRDQNNCILADLMKVFMVSQKQPFILQLT
jgi:hypothetical protein